MLSQRVTKTWFRQSRMYRIIFCGTDHFSLPTLKRIHEEKLYTQLGVLCPIDQRTEKKKPIVPTPVKQYCLDNNIPFAHPADLKKLFVSDFENAKNQFGFGTDPFDVLIAVSFRYFIPSLLLNKDHINVAALNIHPSLLPQYRGAAPIHHALLNGDRETGVSIIELSPVKFDIGNVIKQVKVSIGDEETYDPLFNRLANLGADMMTQVLKGLPQSVQLPQKQSDMSADNTRYKLASKVNHEHCQINWQIESSQQIYNKWRALGDTFCYCDGKKLMLRQLLHPSKTDPTFLQQIASRFTVDDTKSVLIYYKPQRMVYFRSNVDGQWIGCQELQWDTRKAMDALAFGNGLRQEHLVLQ
jgi:methionyl-tRNA formyltransferase